MSVPEKLPIAEPLRTPESHSRHAAGVMTGASGAPVPVQPPPWGERGTEE